MRNTVQWQTTHVCQWCLEEAACTAMFLPHAHHHTIFPFVSSALLAHFVTLSLCFFCFTKILWVRSEINKSTFNIYIYQTCRKHSLDQLFLCCWMIGVIADYTRSTSDTGYYNTRCTNTRTLDHIVIIAHPSDSFICTIDGLQLFCHVSLIGTQLYLISNWIVQFHNEWSRYFVSRFRPMWLGRFVFYKSGM